MVININEIAKSESKELNFSEKIDLKVTFHTSVAKIDFKGSLTNIGDKFNLLGHCLVNILATCSVCLEQYNEELSFDLEEIFSREYSEESLYFEGKEIDISPSIESNIILNLPMRYICSENCKGLCKLCGCNLNNLDCGCDRDFIDPRFGDLLSLFNDKEV